MTRTTLAALCLSAFTFGCAEMTDELSAMDELLVSSISGAEDGMSGETGARMADDGSRPDVSEGGDRSAAPPMFRECDAQGTFIGMVDAYDTDRSGELDGEEPADVIAEHSDMGGGSGPGAGGGGPEGKGPGMGGPREHFLHLLRVVYDTDASRSFEDAELEVIFDDFTARCEAIHAEVLAEYDADGDGELSESEQDTAREGHIAKMEAERAEVDACRDEMGPPPELGARPEEGEAPFGPLEQEFDADGDGALSASELETLRTEMRARIVSGEKPHPECGA
jgi:hypothetical protein